MNVVRILFIPVLVISFLFTGKVEKVQAQSTGLGITAGFNYSSHLKNFRIQVEDVQIDFSPDLSVGYQAGIVFRQPITESLRIQFEPGFIMLGANYDNFTFRGFDFQTDSQTELSYIQLPIVVQWSTVPPERTVFGLQPSVTTYHLTGGFFAGYLLDARFWGSYAGAPVGVERSDDFFNDVIEQYNRFDGGLVLGGGVEHGYRNKIGLEARVFFSIVDSGNAPELNFKPQNVGVSLSVYYLL